MGLLNAGSCGWCLRWPATVSRAVHGQVVDERHRRCALVSTRGPGDGAEFLTACRQKAGPSVGRWRPASPSVGDGFIAWLDERFRLGDVALILRRQVVNRNAQSGRRMKQWTSP